MKPDQGLGAKSKQHHKQHNKQTNKQHKQTNKQQTTNKQLQLIKKTHWGDGHHQEKMANQSQQQQQQ